MAHYDYMVEAERNASINNPKPKSENEVEALVAIFLNDLGWRRYRNHVITAKVIDEETGESRRITIGTKGDPDWTYRRSTEARGLVEILHFEAKAESKKPTGEHGKKQLERIAQLNHIGEPSLWANSLDMFKIWYAEQGFAA